MSSKFSEIYSRSEMWWDCCFFADVRRHFHSVRFRVFRPTKSYICYFLWPYLLQIGSPRILGRKERPKDGRHQKSHGFPNGNDVGPSANRHFILTGFSLPFDLSPTHEKSKSWKYESCLLLDELSTNCNKMEYNLVVQVNCSAFFSFFL